MQVAAARTGQLVSYADISRDVGMSQPTIKIWVDVLHACGLIYLLPPYFNKRTKRPVKTPKLYFMDTGLYGSRPRVYFYRDRDRREVDLLIEESGTLYPVAIKKTAAVKNTACKGFGMLQNLKTPAGHGAVLCMTGALMPVGNNVDAVNAGFL